MCWRIQGHPVCGNIILVCILVSSSFLACEDPLRAKSEINQVKYQTLRYEKIVRNLLYNPLLYAMTLPNRLHYCRWLHHILCTIVVGSTTFFALLSLALPHPLHYCRWLYHILCTIVVGSTTSFALLSLALPHPLHYCCWLYHILCTIVIGSTTSFLYEPFVVYASCSIHYFLVDLETQNNDNVSHIIIQIKVSGYRCESGIDSFT